MATEPRLMQAASVYDHGAPALDGTPVPLRRFEGQVLLIVNVASQCGFTPQYAGLEELWKSLGPRGFAVLGFPCNQFGAQEPGGAEQIRAFCSSRFDVSFPLFAKVEVNGPAAHPLYAYLKHALPGIAGTEAIKWNFTKFLVDRQGRPVKRYGSIVTPAQLRADVQALLGPGV
jgi:glutathione peroxidase-family protein